MPSLHTDRHGLMMSNASAEALEPYDDAVTCFNFFEGNPIGAAGRAIEAAPDFVMAHLLQAHLFALTTQADTTQMAADILERTCDMAMSDRERSHHAALSALVAGNWTEAGQALDRHLMDWPLDIVALQSGHNIDFFSGNARNLRDRIARALPQWSPEMPGYSAVLGMYAFGLEEMGDYGRAEAMGREAVSRDPRDSWAHHAVAHVLEMEGRAEDGVAWMESRAEEWAKDSDYFQTHNWWHKALYHLEMEDIQAALEVYDSQIFTGEDQIVFNLLDGSALLWRVWAAGHDVGDRWGPLAEAWAPHEPGTGYAFNDWHATMAWLGAGQVARVDAQIARLKAVSGNSEANIWLRQICLPLAEGFRAFATGAYEDSLAHLTAIRPMAHRLGGSHAQRDVIDWTMTEAALRAGLAGPATSLAYERLALRPHSPINKGFLLRANALVT